MTGHRPFKELKDKMSPEQRARVEERVKEELAKMTDTKIDLDLIEELDRAASPGPWRVAGEYQDRVEIAWADDQPWLGKNCTSLPQDCELIAYYRNITPELAHEVKDLRKRLKSNTIFSTVDEEAIWLRKERDDAYAALDIAFPEFKFAGLDNGIRKLAEQRDAAREEMDRLRFHLKELASLVARGDGTMSGVIEIANYHLRRNCDMPVKEKNNDQKD